MGFLCLDDDSSRAVHILWHIDGTAHCEIYGRATGQHCERKESDCDEGKCAILHDTWSEGNSRWTLNSSLPPILIDHLHYNRHSDGGDRLDYQLSPIPNHSLFRCFLLAHPNLPGRCSLLHRHHAHYLAQAIRLLHVAVRIGRRRWSWCNQLPFQGVTMVAVEWWITSRADNKPDI